jgi:hypothetical protein
LAVHGQPPPLPKTLVDSRFVKNPNTPPIMPPIIALIIIFSPFLYVFMLKLLNIKIKQIIN